MIMEQIDTVISCVKIEETLSSPGEVSGKNRRSPGGTPYPYRVVFNTGLEVLFSADEVYEYNFYEEAKLRGTFDGLMTRILFRRLLTAVLPYVVYTKRTEQQVKIRAQKVSFPGEAVWAPFQEAAMEQLLDYLRTEGYVHDLHYAESYIRTQMEKPVSSYALIMELQKRGIDGEITAQLLAASAFDDVTAAKALIQKKLGKTGTEPQTLSAKERGKLYRFLSGKGFRGETIRKAMSEYTFAEDGAWDDEYI